MNRNKKEAARSTDAESCKRLKILIAAGGTGGHLFPAQQLCDMLKEEAEVLFAGHQLITSPFFQKGKIPFVEISAHPLKKGFFKAAWKGFWQSVRCIRQFAPDVVVGFGSYHTFPVLLAAAVCRKKIILFEANSLLGKVNRLLAPVASKVAFQFPVKKDSKGTQKTVLVPWLPWKDAGALIDPVDAKRSYGLDPHRKTLLVFGGSQGASFLNTEAPLMVHRLREKVQVIHFTGKAEEQSVRMAYLKLGIDACVKPFESEMLRAYCAADFALCRSGAGTIAELIRFEIPALLIPYPYATDDHQRINGIYLADRVQGARLLVQSEASGERLVEEMERLQKEAKKLKLALQTAKAQPQKRIHLAELIRSIA